MPDDTLPADFETLSTPLICDACLQLKVGFRLAPPDLRPLQPIERVAGRVVPVRHYGSVDIFFEAMERANPGDVLVIDNAGRRDEACIGDLVLLEARHHELGGVVVWGAHRDSKELQQIGLPVFSCGACPAGPQHLEQREADALVSARIGEYEVSTDDFVFGDIDGVIFLPVVALPQLIATAQEIRLRERKQAEKVRAGVSLREQFQFRKYLDRRSAHPDYTFRDHLRAIGGAIES